MARKPTRKEPPTAANDAGGDGLDHWDPANERDMGTIRRLHARYPKAFRTMDEDKQAKLVRIVDRAADVAEKLMEKQDTEVFGAELAESVARTGGMLMGLRMKDEHHAADHNQKERHHADDVARGAGEGTKIQTIVLQGADVSRLLAPPKREVVE